MSLRFHLDECIAPAAAEGLRLRGVDITTADSARLRAEDDLRHLKFATSNERVLVTHDRDFFRLSIAYGDHPGIIFARHQSFTVGELIEAIAIAAECLSADEIRGRIEFL